MPRDSLDAVGVYVIFYERGKGSGPITQWIIPYRK
jgi:hypothetical protein